VALIAFIAGLLVYDVFLVDLYLDSKQEEPQVLEIKCPGEGFVAQAGVTWTREYDEKYPNATLEEKVADWNKMLYAMKCEEFMVSMDDIYYSGLFSDLLHATGTNQATCPTQEEAPEVFEHWYNYYMRGEEPLTDKALMSGWDEIMVRNGCVELLGN